MEFILFKKQEVLLSSIRCAAKHQLIDTILQNRPKLYDFMFLNQLEKEELQKINERIMIGFNAMA